MIHQSLCCICVLIQAGSPVPRNKHLSTKYVQSVWALKNGVVTRNQLSERTSTFIKTMKLLVLIGFTLPNKLQNGISSRVLANFPSLIGLHVFLTELANRPMRLQELCRIVLRHSFSGRGRTVIRRHLLIPQRLMQFLFFEDGTLDWIYIEFV